MDSGLPRVSIFYYEERHLNLCLVCQSNEKILYLPVGRGFTPADVVTVQNAHPSIAQKRDLQEPSLVREGGPLAVDE